MAEHLIVDAMRKAPSLAHNHFLEAAFVLNNAKAAWLAIRRQGGGGGSQALSIASSGDLPRALQRHLAGPTPEAQARRFVIYKVRAVRWTHAGRRGGLRRIAAVTSNTPMCGPQLGYSAVC